MFHCIVLNTVGYSIILSGHKAMLIKTVNKVMVILYLRSGFNDPGPLEKASVEFLKAAMEGDTNKVSDMLVAERVHVDVADWSGHTALMGAGVRSITNLLNCEELLH